MLSLLIFKICQELFIHFHKRKQIIMPTFDNYSFEIDKAIFVNNKKRFFGLLGRNGVEF